MKWYQRIPRNTYEQREARRHQLCHMNLDVTDTSTDRWIATHGTQADANQTRIFKKYLSGKPVCRWLGDWNRDIFSETKAIVEHAKTNNALFQIVLYNIPYRDAGGYSRGGAGSKKEYMEWIHTVAKGIGNATGIIIVEPDALAHADEFGDNLRDKRVSILREVNEYLRWYCKNAYIYLDIGHPYWLLPDRAIELFIHAGGRFIDGIALNVSNYYKTNECYEYGEKVTSAVSDHHGFVIDTSRNGGKAPSSEDRMQVFNYRDARLGEEPTLRVSQPNNYSNRLHALLWIKVPGESDGATEGAPIAGKFHEQGALNLLEHVKDI